MTTTFLNLGGLYYLKVWGYIVYIYIYIYRIVPIVAIVLPFWGYRLGSLI